MLVVEPSTVLIPFDCLDKEFKKTITICNASSQKTRLGIELPLNQQLKFSPLKRGQFYSGESTNVQISFTPNDWNTVQDCFYITSAHEPEPIPIEIKAFPGTTFKIPKQINFGDITVSKEKIIPISLPNNIGVPIEFQIYLSDEQPSHCFSIWPTEGTILPNETTTVQISFLPLMLCHASMKLTIETSLEYADPIQTLCFGSGRLGVSKSKSETNQVVKQVTFKQQKTLKKKEKTTHVLTKAASAVIETPESLFHSLTVEEEQKRRTALLKHLISIGFEPESHYVPDLPMPLPGPPLERRIIAPNAEFVSGLFQTERSKRALVQKFCNAVHKIIYRLRAAKRLERLRLIKTPLYDTEKTLSSFEKTLNSWKHKSCPIEAKPTQQHYQPELQPLAAVPLPKLAETQLVQLQSYTFAEKHGLKPLEHVELDHLRLETLVDTRAGL
ncbi:hypothetical protein EDD86DRAFT_203036 [Gorgonomyces haynaldii]|nr:hypothetical protein EDD86DRAFT_203036 [Gorgonomyces haynaldii]